jgi:hypothetical protein
MRTEIQSVRLGLMERAPRSYGYTLSYPQPLLRLAGAE